MLNVNDKEFTNDRIYKSFLTAAMDKDKDRSIFQFFKPLTVKEIKVRSLSLMKIVARTLFQSL